MDEFDGIIAADGQARRALGDIFVVIDTHGWAFYRHLSFELFALLFILLTVLLGPSYVKRVRRSRGRVMDDFERLTAPVNPEMVLSSTLLRLFKLPSPQRNSGMIYLGWAFGLPLVFAAGAVSTWFMGRPL